MKRTFIWIVSYSLIIWCSSCLKSTTATIGKLANAPRIEGNSYNCNDMVSCVNSLRRLGKTEALSSLRAHIRQNGQTGDPREESKSLLVCRLLFDNPAGWKPPRLGAPSPDVNWKIAGEFPLFPIAWAQGVPFLLLNGYQSGGFTSDTGAACVKICEGLPLISTDLPDSGYVEAAEALIVSERFRRLYTNNDDLRQAAHDLLTSIVEN